MIGNAVRRRLQRLIAFVGIPLVAASAAVVFTAAPAHAGGLTYHGTFRLTTSGLFGCVEVQGAGRTDRTPIIMGTCDGTPNERWAIFRDVDRGVYWILAYGGEWPLNKCMDGPDSDSRIVHIYGCHGGHQQRWLLSTVTPGGSTRIQQAATNECIGISVDPFNGIHRLVQQNCSSSEFPPPFFTLTPA